MKRSTDRILATHVGRLERPDSITEKLVARYAGKLVDQAALDAELRGFVAKVVRQQVEAGINVVNDGEFGRISWLIYAHERLSGFEQRPVELKDAAAILKGKDRTDFADYYAQFASRSGLTYYKSPGATGSSGGLRDHQPVCNHAELQSRTDPDHARSAGSCDDNNSCGTRNARSEGRLGRMYFEGCCKWADELRRFNRDSFRANSVSSFDASMSCCLAP
jgi:hypothetical protein